MNGRRHVAHAALLGRGWWRGEVRAGAGRREAGRRDERGGRLRSGLRTRQFHTGEFSISIRTTVDVSGQVISESL